MRIFSKASLEFRHPKDSSLKARVRANDFANVPDWVPQSRMFKLAANDETVTIIDSKAKEISAEKNAGKPPRGGRGAGKGAKNDGDNDPNDKDQNPNPDGDQTPDGSDDSQTGGDEQ